MGERGDVTQTVRVGPAVLTRQQTWDDLPALAEIFRRAGCEVEALDPRSSVLDLPEPDVWVLSDLPFAAAVASGLLARLADARRTGGAMMLGGALSFAGQHAAGGWAACDAMPLWPVVIATDDDTREAPDGLMMRPTEACPRDLAKLIQDAPPVYGHNTAAARPGATVLAEFEGSGPAIVAADQGGRRSVVLMSDVMPHWGAAMTDWASLPEFIAALTAIAAHST